MKQYMMMGLALISASAVAFERQHGSHEHGAASVLVAIEGNELQLKLESPAANLIGFEHAPGNAEEKQRLKNTVARLRAAEDFIKLPGKAECRVEMASVLHSVGAEDPYAEEDHHKHDEHDHDEHGHEGHDHDEHQGESHSDFIVEYHFECNNMDQLTQMKVELFSQFPLLESLDLQYISPQGQGAAELTAKTPVFRF